MSATFSGASIQVRGQDLPARYNTPAVVGVVLNLGVWFETHALFQTECFAWFSAILAVISFCLMQFYQVGIIVIIAGSGSASLIWYLLGF